ncbi:MAG: Gfo/Idh/MocA family oxidoreductase [Bacteroidota bacterium]
MSTPPLRLGLIGCGHLAREVHLPLLAAMPGVEVVALADPDAAARAEAARIVPTASGHAHHADLLGVGLDAVVACPPTAAHAGVACDVLGAGVPLYLEKPIATILPDAERVVAAWRAAGVPAMLGFNYRFNPLYADLRRRLRSGAVGEVIAVRTVFSTQGGGGGWRGQRGAGGGVLLDLAAHHVDLVRFLLGDEVAAVSASLRSRRTDDDTATLDLRMASGVTVQTFCSLSATEADRVEVIGEGGVLRASRYASLAVEQTGASATGAVPSVVGEVVRSATAAPYLLQKRAAPWGEPSFGAALSAFVEAVRSGTPASPDPVDGLQCLAVIAAAERSAREGRLVEVDAPEVAASVAPVPAVDRPVPEAERRAEAPALSVIALLPNGPAPMRTTMAHLGAQDVRAQIEVVLVAPEGVAVDPEAMDLGGFAGWQLLRVPEMRLSGPTRALAVRAARAPVVVPVEDHCFPQTGWAAGLLAALETPAAVAAGPSFGNGNPASRTSWVDYLMSFGAYADHDETRPRGGTAWHNSAYRRSALLAFGDRLGELLDVEGPLQQALIERGGVLVQSADARVEHLNFSHTGWMLAQHAVNGRQFGAARSVGWSPARRAIHAVTAPLIPLARLRHVQGAARRAGRAGELGAASVPLLLAALSASAAGEVVGSLFGPGRAPERKFDMEFRRHRFMSARDRRTFAPLDS